MAFYWQSPQFLCRILGVVPFNMWLTSRWEENNCCYKLSNWQNDNSFHSKWQLWQFCAFAQFVTTVIFFSAWDKSHVKWDNSRNSTQKMKTLMLCHFQQRTCPGRGQSNFEFLPQFPPYSCSYNHQQCQNYNGSQWCLDVDEGENVHGVLIVSNDTTTISYGSKLTIATQKSYKVNKATVMSALWLYHIFEWWLLIFFYF